MRRVFADSSVIIAGAYSRTGASRAVLSMAEVGLFQLVISRQVVDECERLLTLNTKDFTPQVAAASGLTIQTPGEFVRDLRTIVTEGLGESPTCSLHQLKQPVWAERDFGDLNAEFRQRIFQRLGKERANRNRARFAGALDAERIER